MCLIGLTDAYNELTVLLTSACYNKLTGTLARGAVKRAYGPSVPNVLII